MPEPIVLFGCGGIGAPVAQLLTDAGIPFEPADNNLHKQLVTVFFGKKISGPEVFADNEHRYVLAMSNQEMARRQLHALGVREENITTYDDFLRQHSLSVNGFCRKAELDWLQTIARTREPRTIWVEVGVWKGQSFSVVARALPPTCSIFAVDLWEGAEGADPLAGGDVYREWRQTYAQLRKERPNINFLQIREDSVSAASRFLGGQVDVCFLDADHSEEAVYADLKAWGPRMKDGGILCGHDLGVASELRDLGLAPDWPGVEKALTRYCKESGRKFEQVVGSIWRLA